MATLISIIFVVIFTVFLNAATSLGFLSVIALVAGALFFLMTPLIKGMTMLPLQAASVESSSKALHFARRDMKLNFLTLVWISFALFSFFVAAFSSDWLFIIWVIWLGLSIDAIYLYTRFATGYADPFHLIEVFVKRGNGFFAEKNHKEFCTTIDGLGEICLKALYQRSIPLAIEGITALDRLTEDYLKEKNQEGSEVISSVSYTLGFLLHRLQMIFDQAAEDRLEPLANQVVLSTSKLTLAVARYDAELTSLPLHFLEKFMETAKEYDLKEVSLNSSIILLEVAKSVLEDPDLREREIGTLMFAVIEQLERIAKETFREDKNIPINLLTEPFMELKTLLDTKIPPFPDSRAIAADLERVLVEFQALESVLKSVPNIPGYSEVPAEETSES